MILPSFLYSNGGMAGETATLTTSPLVLSEQPFKTEKESNINHKERTFLNMLEDLFFFEFLGYSAIGR